jgi:hypothetical protein
MENRLFINYRAAEIYSLCRFHCLDMDILIITDDSLHTDDSFAHNLWQNLDDMPDFRL